MDKEHKEHSLIVRLLDTRAAVFLFATLIVVVLMLTGTIMQNFWRQLWPHDHWLTVERLDIPHHTAGSNPDVLFRRIVPEGSAWYSEWFVEAHDTKTNNEMTGCRGRGQAYMQPGDVKLKFSLNAYVGSTCKLPPGCYELHSYWYPTIGDWRRDRPIPHISNEFCVVAE